MLLSERQKRVWTAKNNEKRTQHCKKHLKKSHKHNKYCYKYNFIKIMILLIKKDVKNKEGKLSVKMNKILSRTGNSTSKF